MKGSSRWYFPRFGTGRIFFLSSMTRTTSYSNRSPKISFVRRASALTNPSSQSLPHVQENQARHDTDAGAAAPQSVPTRITISISIPLTPALTRHTTLTSLPARIHGFRRSLSQQDVGEYQYPGAFVGPSSCSSSALLGPLWFSCNPDLPPNSGHLQMPSH